MRRTAIVLALLLAVTGNAFAGRVIISNSDKPGTGFNDPTPVEPVGGNPGTTLGEQRLNVFQAAAERWQNLLDTNVDIVVTATFAPIIIATDRCTSTSGILGAARAQLFKNNFKNAPRQDVWYPIALANKFAGEDLAPTVGDIFAQFNAEVDDPTCLGTRDWYYGLDGKHGLDFDLYVVVLHEIAHGLGISGPTSAPGFVDARPSVFDTHTLDVATGLRWDQMTPAQRNTSYLNTANVVWDGAATRAAAARYLTPITTLSVSAPAPVARNFDVGAAVYGPALARASMDGVIVAATDGEASTTDGCQTFTNNVNGKIALVDRGTCDFVIKTRNAQNAGAIGVIIVDNVRADTCTPPGLGATLDTSDIVIPTVGLRASDGDLLKTQLSANVNVAARLRTDAGQLAGTSTEGYPRLYAPCTSQPGSSIHHWDVIASPNLLMEPNISSDLLHGVDITIDQLIDLGWTTPARTGRRVLKR